jgi:hypothetical protein
MITIFTTISKFISSDYILVRHSALTQNLVGSNNTILWNDSPCNVDLDIYDKFKEALKKRGSKFYTHNQTLPYCDFCIALISSNNYSLNHLSTPSIPPRTYTAAWRSLYIISSTADTAVKGWLSKYMSGRTASGYSTTHGIQLDNNISPNIESSNENKSTEIVRDKNILDIALCSRKVIEIPYHNDGDIDIGVLHSTPTPECQVADLRIYHDVMCDIN